MKIGMCMFLWTTSVGRDHEPLLRDIAKTGFDGVEIPIFDGTPEDYAALGRMLDDLGLDRTAVSANGDPAQNLVSADAAERRAGVDHVKRAIDCAQALGAPKLSGPLHSTLGHFSGTGPTEAELARSVAAQREIGDHAAGAGVTVCLEALNRFECYLLTTMDGLAAHLDDIGHRNIRAMYDTFHANIEEQDPLEALIRNAGHVAHIHISENDRGVPGRGHINWDATFDAIAESGYDGWLTIEAFGRGLPDLAAATKVWRDFAESPEAVYREGYQMIRAQLDRIGA
ncbi:sugar phosphate isomerase/epimerase family protein [Oceanomicrobium pacificus]|uniref:TIM barrel protein n=1 Tax=Oceanomicrobium pacificus TaxID=2692916 RepID=A0A6B0TIW4_9RHOB|nr:sugar phosphate isomerase/epimerase [Oceanomicrobium pacificus]MXU64317.1 TIM barrel protein [Oceanomicrobium pacificus]